MKSADYWKKRMESIEDMSHSKGVAYANNVEEQFRQAEKALDDKIAIWYQRLADNNEISLSAAKKLLSDDELEDFHMDVNEYIKKGKTLKYDDKWAKQLENASAKVHISRLEAMKLQMQQQCEVLYGNMTDGLDAHLRDVYTDGYYHTAFELQKGINTGWGFNKLDNRKIEKAINSCWTNDGNTFKARCWTNKNKLVNELNTILTQNIIRGEDPQKAINQLVHRMNVSKHNAGRLIMTETAATYSMSQRDCYKELDVEQFKFLATLDTHTSEICRKMDGKHFEMSDYQIGVNAPPLHCFCRSCTVPYFNDEFTVGEKRAARWKDGKTCYVSSDMTYEEWEKTFVNDPGTKGSTAKKEADYLIRSHTPGQNVTEERKLVKAVIASVPLKVQLALKNTVIDVGKDGASQYDYSHDILYIAKGAEKEDIIHEIGHMVENNMLDENKVTALRKQIVQDISPNDITRDIMYDAAGNAHEVFIIKSDTFVSEYQGRIYANDWDEIYDENWNIRDDKMWEFMSEPFREYMQNPGRLKEKYPEFYKLIREAVE